MGKRDWTGIEKSGHGYRVSVSRGYGVTPYRKHFPADTSLKAMQDWRKDQQAKARLERRPRATAGTFAADARQYLKAVKAMPTYEQRKRDIELWIDVFGLTQRHSIRSTDIQIQRETWLTEPRSRKDSRPLAANTVNKRLRALSNLWTVLDGPKAPNPVKDVPEADEPDAVIRAIDYDTIAKIIDGMPDVTRSDKGMARGQFSQTKARLRVLAYTGWPPGVLSELTRDDIDWKHGTARLPSRKKGKGVKTSIVPLLPPAVNALRQFDLLNCWGKFSRGSMRKVWKRALKRLNLPTTLRVYDLRHSFGTALVSASKDEGAVQTLMHHADVKTTRRYTERSVPVRLIDARDALANALKTG